MHRKSTTQHRSLVIIISFFILYSVKSSSIDSNNNTECSIVNDEYCVIKIHQQLKLIDDSISLCGESTAVYPYECVNDESKCDFILNWFLKTSLPDTNDRQQQKQQYIEFTLTKPLYRLNQWVALVISQERSVNSRLAQSEIIITTFPDNKETPKIING
jgi:hypothetical protein